MPFLQRKERLRKTITNVCQSKEDMKQWNGEKMRKWSHTFSTCSKTSHPHSPLIDHGSCCHRVHAELSFLWFKKSDVQWQTYLVICLAFLSVLFYFKGNPVHRKDSSSFPALVMEKTVQVMGDQSIWQTDEAVFTHTWCSFTLEYIHWATSVCLCVCVCPPLPLFTWRKLTPSPTLTSGHESNEAENMTHTHTFPYTQQHTGCTYTYKHVQRREMLQYQPIVWKMRILFTTVSQSGHLSCDFLVLETRPSFLLLAIWAGLPTVLLERSRSVCQASPLTLLTVTSQLSVLTNPWPFTLCALRNPTVHSMCICPILNCAHTYTHTCFGNDRGHVAQVKV